MHHHVHNLIGGAQYYRSGYSFLTRRILLQAIRPALNNSHIGFTSMVGAQVTKG